MNGESCLPVVVRHGSSALQAWPVAQVQAGDVMPGKGELLANGGSTTKSALSYVHWNNLQCKPCSDCHLLWLVKLALVCMGKVFSVALGVTAFCRVRP
jgi:hypothetical protein